MKPVTRVPNFARSIFKRGISLTLSAPRSEKHTPSPNEHKRATLFTNMGSPFRHACLTWLPGAAGAGCCPG